MGLNADLGLLCCKGTAKIMWPPFRQRATSKPCDFLVERIFAARPSAEWSLAFAKYELALAVLFVLSWAAMMSAAFRDNGIRCSR